MSQADPSSTSAAPVRAGEILAGKYRVERVLGRGGMGVVVAATHVQLGERVALKFLLPEASTSADVVARFLREAQAAVKIKGEHVARVSDVGTLASGAPYIVMEYLEGHDLGAVLHGRGPLPTNDVVHYVLQACEALAAAHAAGIVHRDLKPANLFLTRKPDGSPLIKVLDFGISKLTVGLAADAALTRTSSLMGSPLYMSPEQMRAARDVDARSDIWSLGVVMYELLTGRPPFEADTMPMLCALVFTESPRPLHELRPDAPPALGAVVARCLQRDLPARFQTIAEVARALGELGGMEGQLAAQRVSRIARETGPSLSSPTLPAPRSTGDTPLAAVGWAAGPHASGPSFAAATTAMAASRADDLAVTRVASRRPVLPIALGGAGLALLGALGVFLAAGKRGQEDPGHPASEAGVSPSVAAPFASAGMPSAAPSAGAPGPELPPAPVIAPATALPAPPAPIASMRETGAKTGGDGAKKGIMDYRK